MKQFIKFAFVGVLNTAIHYAVFYVLYAYVGFYHLLASGIGYVIATVNSYILNRRWTFRSRSVAVGQEFGRFFLVNLASMSVNLLSMAVLVEIVGIDPPIAQLLTIALTLAVNFTGNKLWTFRQQSGN